MKKRQHGRDIKAYDATRQNDERQQQKSPNKEFKDIDVFDDVSQGLRTANDNTVRSNDLEEHEAGSSDNFQAVGLLEIDSVGAPLDIRCLDHQHARQSHHRNICSEYSFVFACLHCVEKKRNFLTEMGLLKIDIFAIVCQNSTTCNCLKIKIRYIKRQRFVYVNKNVNKG